MNSFSPSYTIAALVSAEIDERVRQLRSFLGDNTRQQNTKENGIITKNIAHLTLHYSFYLPSQFHEAGLITNLKKVKFAPILVQSEELEIFDTQTQGRVLVALVNRSKELLSLQEQIRNQIDKPSIQMPNQQSFNPHISLVYAVPQDRERELLEKAQREILPIAFILGGFYLLREIQDIKGEREIIKEFRANKFG